MSVDISKAKHGPTASPSPILEDEDMRLHKCCEDTIHTHAANNPMMVCGHCKRIIKCFEQEGAYRNYVRFCKSRNRKFLAMYHQPYHIVVFRAYNAMTSNY